MKFRKYIFLIFLFYSYIPVLAQVDTAWVRRYNGPGNGGDWASALAVDTAGNVYVTGYSEGSGASIDYATIKYSPNGDTLWVRRYNGSGNDNDWASALAVDNAGNVYVTGISWGIRWDYATIKYAPNGDTLWVRRYDGPGNFNDDAFALALDNAGNVYVTGYSTGSGTQYDYATIKYASNGDTLWVRRYNGPANGSDEAYALAVDDSGNVYVTGVSHYDYATIKYAPNGDTLWVRHYSGPGYSNGWASALELDTVGNVYVTGSSQGTLTSYDYATIKYAPNGDTLWVRRYNGPGNYDDFALALAVDDSGNVYVAGTADENCFIECSPGDYATIKYSSAGDTLWVRRYKGRHDGYFNYLSGALAVDNSGNLYLTVPSSDSVTYNDYATIKYAPNGDTLWVRRYDGPGNSYDDPYALTVDNSGNVYVTGSSEDSVTYDYATIKYVQCFAKPGDANGDGKILLPDIVTIINFLFRSAPAPTPFCRGDANGNGNILLPDIVYLINFLFRSGPAPVKSKECCL